MRMNNEDKDIKKSDFEEDVKSKKGLVAPLQKLVKKKPSSKKKKG